MTTTHSIQFVNMKNGAVAVHKAGCSDLKKLRANGHTVMDAEATTSRRAAFLDYNAEFLAEGDEGYDLDWKACANHVPAEDEQPVEEPTEATTREADFEARRAERKADKDMRSNRVTKDADEAQKPLTRKQCNAILAELGYTGPTSYLMPKLRDIVAAEQAKQA